MRILRIFFLIVIFITMITASVSIAAENGVESFRSSLRNGNSSLIKQVVHPKGLILVRLYNQNNPHRKADFITKINEIPSDFKISVSNDLPFDLPYLFGGSIRNKSLVYLNGTVSDDGLNENSVSSIRIFARHVLSFINTKTRSFTPTVAYTKDGYLILTEGEFNDNMLSGSLAVFQKSGGQYLLRMIIDMK